MVLCEAERAGDGLAAASAVVAVWLQVWWCGGRWGGDGWRRRAVAIHRQWPMHTTDMSDTCESSSPSPAAPIAQDISATGSGARTGESSLPSGSAMLREVWAGWAGLDLAWGGLAFGILRFFMSGALGFYDLGVWGLGFGDSRLSDSRRSD